MLFNHFFQDNFSIIILILLFWLLALSIVLYKMVIHYKKLLGKSKKHNLKKILDEVLVKLQKQDKILEGIDKRCDGLEKDGLKHFQKMGFLRFNPFSDTGGDQSFVLSVLDGKENGIVLSSLHSRGTTRLYAKSVKRGQGEMIKLSREEKNAIKKAKSKRS